MQTILLHKICIEIENARAFTTNEIAKMQHVKFNPRSTKCYIGAKTELTSSSPTSGAQERQV